MTLAHHDNWTQKIFAWADEFEIPENEVPRDKEKLLAITELNLNRYDENKAHLPKITYLPNEIGQLTNLERLSIGNNQLTQLSESIGQLTKLTELNIRYNQLSTLPESICHLKELRQLDLTGNPLTELSKPVKDFLRTIPRVHGYNK
ncbi:leucine-rich repeat domain-containing protein [Psychrobacter sp. I-STPA10]|uniref:leucine-rich repeat domain-containing protein n=1 Tax=Psychrobacter sp. I-STPA10 TaxID=2585769 RepID=UPI001E5208AA|nr:leucine-rich repeat domain-containing protein [Psychrobacter sp. I-STPA10]